MRAFFTMAAIAASTLTASVSSAAVIFNDDFAGTSGAITTSTPEVGSASWVQVASREMRLSGSGTAIRGANTNATARIDLATASVLATDTLRLDLTVGTLGTAGAFDRVTAGFAQPTGSTINGGTSNATLVSISVLNNPVDTIRVTRTNSLAAVGSSTLADYSSAGVVAGDVLSLSIDIAANTVNVLKNNVVLNGAPLALGYDFTTSGTTGVGRLMVELGDNSNGAIDNVTVSNVAVVPEPTSALAIGGIVATLLRRRSR
jgi:hypothetical protein